METVIYKALSDKVLGMAYTVHNILGSGLLEHAYKEAMCVELRLAGIPFEREQVFALEYSAGRLLFRFPLLFYPARFPQKTAEIDAAVGPESDPFRLQKLPLQLAARPRRERDAAPAVDDAVPGKPRLCRRTSAGCGPPVGRPGGSRRARRSGRTSPLSRGGFS
jgi:hypothetical protein